MLTVRSTEVPVNRYFGRYAEFDTVSKKDAAVLLGADCMVGDVLSVDCQLEEGEHRAWLVNQFDARVGFLSAEISREMSLLAARGFRLNAVLSFVAFTDHPDEGHYWGDVALVCFKESLAACFEPFLQEVSARAAEGIRTRVDLGPDAVSRIVESEGAWLPKETVPMPEKVKGTAIIKRRRGLNDKLITQGRAGNKGCYVAGWAFLLIAVALAVLSLKSCFFG